MDTGNFRCGDLIKEAIRILINLVILALRELVFLCILVGVENRTFRGRVEVRFMKISIIFIVFNLPSNIQIPIHKIIVRNA